MPGFLSSLLDGRAAEDVVHGFVWASGADAGEWAHAAPGQVIHNPGDGAPWIVVAHTVDAVLPVRWPGRLWEVEVLRMAPEQPREGASYSRAVAVRITRELPPAILFGSHGDDVVRVIDRASSLDGSEAAELAARWSEQASEAYSQAWNAWIARMAPGSIHRGADHGNTLAVFAGGTRSPLGSAFTLLHDVVGRRAREVAGEAAFVADEDGEMCLAGPWAKAAEALLHAAMALGAPDLVPEADQAVLLAAWR